MAGVLRDVVFGKVMKQLRIDVASIDKCMKDDVTKRVSLSAFGACVNVYVFVEYSQCTSADEGVESFRS